MKRKVSRNPKRAAKIRRSLKTRKKLQQLDVPHLTVHRSLKHIYAQIIHRGCVLATASSLEKEIKEQGSGGNVKISEEIGRLIAERAIAKGLAKVAFDRSGFKYHGRVKAVAESARKAGLTI